MYDKDWGYVLSSEPQTLRQSLNFIDVILQIPICYRRQERKRNTNIKVHMLVHFSIASQFYIYVNVELYVHTFMYWKKRRSFTILRLCKCGIICTHKSGFIFTRFFVRVYCRICYQTSKVMFLVANPQYTILLMPRRNDIILL